MYKPRCNNIYKGLGKAWGEATSVTINGGDGADTFKTRGR
jgi:hypothetical protein